MSEIKYSLCIAEIDYNTNEVRNKVLRIADYDAAQECLVEAYYSDREEKSIDNYYPRHIRAFANTLTPYKPEIRNWNVVTGVNSYTGEAFLNTESNSLHKYPIEMLFLSEIDLEIHNSDAAIRRIFQEGISIPEYVSDNFLLVINKSNISYEALLCSKKHFYNSSNTDKFKIQRHCTDMLRTVHNLGLHVIKQEEVLDTGHCSIFFEQGKKARTQYFYKYLTANREDRKFLLRNPEDYAKAFISKYIKNNKEILKISKADAQKCATMINDAFSNKSELEVFFNETGFRNSDIEYALRDLSDDIRELYLQDDDFSRIVERVLLKDPAVLDRCKEEAKKIWILEQDELKDEILSKIQTTQNNLSALISNKDSLNTEVIKLTETINKLNNECLGLQEQEKLLTDKCFGLQEKIKEELQHFQADVVHLAATSSFGISNAPAPSRSHDPYIVQPEISMATTETTIEDISGFLDDLQDNLVTFGLDNDHSYDFALFITSGMLLHKNLVICGSKSTEIGNSVSFLLESQTAKQVYLSTGYDNINQLICTINQLPNKVFIINNALDTISDAIFLSLSKCCPDKLLLFSCEDPTTYRCFPSQWGNYAVFIYPDSVWSFPSNDDLRLGRFDLFSQIPEMEMKSIPFVKEVKATVHVKASHINNVMQVMSLYETLEGRSTPLTFSTLCNFIASIGLKKEAVSEILLKSNVSEDVVDLIKGEFCYE